MNCSERDLDIFLIAVRENPAMTELRVLISRAFVGGGTAIPWRGKKDLFLVLHTNSLWGQELFFYRRWIVCKNGELVSSPLILTKNGEDN